jgi:hypothetical protein
MFLSGEPFLLNGRHWLSIANQDCGSAVAAFKSKQYNPKMFNKTAMEK